MFVEVVPGVTPTPSHSSGSPRDDAATARNGFDELESDGGDDLGESVDKRRLVLAEAEFYSLPGVPMLPLESVTVRSRI